MEEDAQLMKMKKEEEEEQNRTNRIRTTRFNSTYTPIQLTQLSHSTQLNSLSNPYPTLPYPILFYSYSYSILFYSIHNRLTD